MKLIKVLFLLILSNSSLAAVIDITAEYKPESYDSNGGRFINTTPCDVGVNITFCDPQKPLESSVIIKLPVSITKTINSARGKQSYLNYYHINGPRKVTLTNNSNGEQHQLTLIPTDIGARVIEMNYPVVNNEKWPMHKIDGDCSSPYQGWGWWIGSTVTTQMDLFAINNSAQNGPSECYYNSQVGDGSSYKFEWLLYGFRMKSPSPLKMSNGRYTGSIKISVGRGKDIDLGNSIYSGGTEHELRFALTVRHQLKIDFPKDGHSKVNLLPPGGWSEWTRPTILQEELPFRIWFSAPFTLALRCQYKWSASSECALKDGKGRTVPLKTYYVGNINKMALLTTNKQRFAPPVQGTPVINAARSIRFQVVGGAVVEMMKYPGSSFKGDVTLIFDAAID